MDKHTIKTIENRVAEVAGMTLPGLLVLDIIFKKGLLHVPPSSWMEFVLLLIYALGLSAPTYITCYAAASPLFWTATDPNQDKEEELRSGFSFFLLPFNLLITVCVIWLFQYLNSSHRFESIGSVGISPRGLQLVVAYIAATIISGLILYFLHRALDRIANQGGKS